MKQFHRLDGLCLALASALFGIHSLLNALSLIAAEPGHPFNIAARPAACAMALCLICFAASLMWNRGTVLTGTALAVALVIRISVAYLPGLVHDIHGALLWARIFELVLLLGGVLISMAAAGPFPTILLQRNDRIRGAFVSIGRALYVFSLIVFGTQHFMYAKFISTIVPLWIPAALFWTYFVGVAFFAAALSVSTGVLARWAANLAGWMFLSWVVVLHLPRVLRDVHVGREWTNAFVALAAGGVSFIVASSFRSCSNAADNSPSNTAKR